MSALTDIKEKIVLVKHHLDDMYKQIPEDIEDVILEDEENEEIVLSDDIIEWLDGCVEAIETYIEEMQSEE